MEGKIGHSTRPFLEQICIRRANHLRLNSKVPAGRFIQFKGTDLLTVDLASKKVANVTTSADLLNDFRALGYNLGVLNPS